MWVVGGERRGRMAKEERGELMENGVVSQLIGDALPGLQCLLFPSWLPDAIVNCSDTVRLWLLSSGSTAANTAPGVCNMSVLLYTCTAVIAVMYVWVGGPGDCSFCAACGRAAWLLCVYEGESYRDSRLGRSHGASSGSLSNWLFCSILKESKKKTPISQL